MALPLIRPFRLTIGETSFVSVLTDLPDAVSGVITLPGGTSWVLCGALDLMGSRIVCTGPVAIMGASPETCIITSTGLTSQPIISTATSLSLHKVGLIVPSGCTGVAAASVGDELALDWSYVNFSGVGRSVHIGDASNVVMHTIGWLGANGLLLDGEVGTVKITSSIFVLSSGQTGIYVDTDALITRRLQVETSALIVPSGATGIYATEANIAQSEGLDLFRLNASGDGTALDGISYTSDKVRIRECRGFNNTRRIAIMRATGNTTATPTSAGTPAVVLFDSTSLDSNSLRFDMPATGELRYIAAFSEVVSVTISLDVSASNGDQVTASVERMLAGGGSSILADTATATTNAGGRVENMMLVSIVPLDEVDKLRLRIDNDNSNNTTVTHMTFRVTD